MRVFSKPKETPKYTIATVGTFDGVHLGHQAILKTIKERADMQNSESLLITFDPPPPLFFGVTHSLLSSKNEKIEVLQENHLQNLLILRFSNQLAQMEPEDFIERILVTELKVKEVVIGKTHRFGRKKSGDFKLLEKFGEKLGFRVDVLQPVTYEDIPISSSRVRATLENGEVDRVREMLGRSYSFSGKVVKGTGRGKMLEYPTANLEVDSLKLLPANGVYAVRAELDNRNFPAVMNIGTRPTFGNANKNIEVHLLDFDQVLYGKSLKIYCIKRLRAERIFENEKSLKSQIERDLKTAKELL